MATVEYTKKSLDKIKQFTNLKRSAAEKLVRRAFVNGTDINNLSAATKSYFESFIDITKRRGLVYGDLCYVFADNYCVNVLKFPKKTSYNGKNKIKNPKKYTKLYKTEMYA